MLGCAFAGEAILLNLAGGTRSASEKSNPTVAFAQYSALRFGFKRRPAANAEMQRITLSRE